MLGTVEGRVKGCQEECALKNEKRPLKVKNQFKFAIMFVFLITPPNCFN